MKVLHINSYYSGSAFYKNLYDIQKEDKIDLSVYVPVSNSYKNILDEFGDYTTISRVYKKYDRVIFHLKHRKILNDIKKVYDINKFEVMHAHSLFSNGYIAMKLKRQFKIPYIVAVRNTDVNIFFKKMINLRYLGIQILQEADKVVFLSTSYKEEVISKYIPNKVKNEILNKSIVIPNGIDNFWHSNKENKNIINLNKLNLLYVGIINNNKNIAITLEAIDILKSRGYEIEFTIVGEIQDNNIFNKINKKDYTKYIPPTDKEKLLNIYRHNHIFIMPSIKETFGLVYAEAMSQGLPIVYTRNQGFDKQFKEGEVGLSVDCLNPLDIANKIIDISDNYFNISKNCTKLSKKFKWDEINKKYYDIYTSIRREIK